ncbi:MAG: hypothetical protein IJ745_03265 [Bacteroidales bacterium]|nr:hypothetical protein [Bacteroidales bacterium]
MRYALDPDPEAPPLQNLALILFHTQAPNYAFVDDLNHLYQLRLSRQTDLAIATPGWPHYAFNDLLNKISYHFVERPLTHSDTHTVPIPPFWPPLHKMLFIIGDFSQSIADRMLDEFSLLPPEPDPIDLAASARHAILRTLHQDFTPVSSIDINSQLPPSASKKAQREYAENQQFLFSIVDLIC